jgi:PIN domain nuclease of toxin-antitoxin system
VLPAVLRRALLDGGWQVLPIEAHHALAVAALPPLHRDPFDRLLLAQACAEGLLLITADQQLAQYPAPVRLMPAGR